MKKTVYILVNSKAGTCRDTLATRVRQSLIGWPVELLSPPTIAKAKFLVSKLQKHSTEALIIVGGDGSLNQMLSEIAYTGIPVIPFPAGTANDLAREQNITKDLDTLQCILAQRAYENIDLIKANDCYVATIGGIGMGSYLTQTVNTMRSKSPTFRFIWQNAGSAAYGLLGIGVAFKSNRYSQRILIKHGDEKIIAEPSSVFICNQSSLGGDLKMSPKSNNKNGLFEVVVIGAKESSEIILNTIRAKLGSRLPGSHRFFTDQCVQYENSSIRT